MDYPETLAEYHAYMRVLELRKASPQGYLRARYDCTDWWKTNDLVIPKSSRLQVYLPPFHGSNLLARILSLSATEVNIRTGIVPALPAVNAEISVADYRYKRADEKRIFKYAQYTLRPGDSWRSGNDPGLVAKANTWLKSGRKYRHFAGSGKRWAAWLVLAIILAPLVAMMLKRLKPQT